MNTLRVETVDNEVCIVSPAHSIVIGHEQAIDLAAALLKHALVLWRKSRIRPVGEVDAEFHGTLPTVSLYGKGRGIE